MSKRYAEPELTSAQIHELIDLARKTDESLSTLDGSNQAMYLLRTFNMADRVYGLWPDSAQPSGYAYGIMKGKLGSAAMRRVAKNAEISVTAVFQEGEDHADLTGEVYGGLESCADDHPEAYAQAFNFWINIVPANFEATKARIRGYILG
ncbi:MULTISPECIES: hypothetical protein [Methylobacteriaceae]|jgi:hypothetical protein|uniref:Uncharacterized protein n=1 Tax=Methylobacterium gregans TaxID=374424 RepID=A0AA37HT98_9HYPH|nr:hypothetical protein [Methylobacterium gregans]MDQ0522318.1 hypothetical protein [Methylobacterium gregans]GJD81460.1 hypothetical protein NBEOAGPD_4709 [Methylobacterium gregans]GLS55061.1 hypothetical protein GCM10007886_32450 [Methylobacterium gregans]